MTSYKSCADTPRRSYARTMRLALAALWLLALTGALTTAAALGLADGPATGFFGRLAHWFADIDHWQGRDGIIHRSLQYLWYAGVSISVGVAIALPVGIALGHSGRGGLLAINLANIGRAVPSFGLIILMFLLVGFGFVPVLVALVALAIPPMVTNSFVGMRSVDPAVREAATATGMSGRQRLWRVELPIALPLVMAGVRTSAVQVMSTAVLAAYVGLGGLGRYLIDGLAQQDMTQVVAGAILVAIFAVATEFVLAALQKGMVSKGLAR